MEIIPGICDWKSYKNKCYYAVMNYAYFAVSVFCRNKKNVGESRHMNILDDLLKVTNLSYAT